MMLFKSESGLKSTHVQHGSPCFAMSKASTVAVSSLFRLIEYVITHNLCTVVPLLE